MKGQSSYRCALCALALTVAADAGLARAAAYAFTTLDDPIALLYPNGSTGAFGISDATVVGDFSIGEGDGDGFSETGGIYTSLRYPPSGGSGDIFGVSGNTVVGTYVDKTGTHGFSETNGVYTVIDDPLADNVGGTEVLGISGGTVVGSFEEDPITPNSFGAEYGFTETGGVYTTWAAPSAVSTFATGVSGDTVVGYFWMGGNSDYQGFIETDGVYTTLDDPLATGDTDAYGVSGNTVVGTYVDRAGDHGFIEMNGIFTTLDDPAALPGTTFVYGVSGTTVVGQFSDGAGAHGFIATLVPEPASLALLVLSAVPMLVRRRRASR